MSTEIVRTAVERQLADGQIVSLADLKKALAKPATQPPPPAVVPLPKEITEPQRAALEILPTVFGMVVPDQKRALTPGELSLLHTERQTLDTVEKMAAARKADIRTTLVNHFDVQAEAAGVPEGTFRDAEGHVLKSAKVIIPGTDRAFSWEVRDGSGGDITDQALQDLVKDPDSAFTHEDYLAMTSQVRVVDEPKFLLHLRKHPELAAEIAKAITPKGAPVGALYVRSAK